MWESCEHYAAFDVVDLALAIIYIICLSFNSSAIPFVAADRSWFLSMQLMDTEAIVAQLCVKHSRRVYLR